MERGRDARAAVHGAVLIFLILSLSGCAGSSDGADVDDEGPVITSISHTGATSTGVTFRWTVTGGEGIASHAEYGTTSSYGTLSAHQTGGGAKSVSVTGLQAGTTYHWRVRASDNTGDNASEDRTFTTTASSSSGSDTTDPVLTNVRCQAATDDSVTVLWTVADNSGDADSSVEYGATTGYGTTSAVQSGVGAKLVELTSLGSGSIFHFRVVAEDASGNGATSSDGTFATEPAHVHVGTNTAFDPRSICISAGTSVTFHLHTGTHTVTIHKDGDPTGEYVHDTDPFLATTTYDFPDAATYHIFCKPHSNGENGAYSSGMVSTALVD